MFWSHMQRVFLVILGTIVYIILAIVGAEHFTSWLDTLLILLSVRPYDMSVPNANGLTHKYICSTGSPSTLVSSSSNTSSSGTGLDLGLGLGLGRAGRGTTRTTIPRLSTFRSGSQRFLRFPWVSAAQWYVGVLGRRSEFRHWYSWYIF